MLSMLLIAACPLPPQATSPADPPPLAFELVASDTSPGDRFGFSVDVDGDTAVVGAPRHAVGTSRGAVYVFQREVAGAWTLAQKVVPSVPFRDEFGYDVAVSDDTLAISYFELSEVHVYQRGLLVPGRFDLVARLTSPYLFTGFGHRIDLEGDLLAVGGPGQGDALNLGNASGGLYLYDRNEGGPDAWGMVFEYNDGICTGLGWDVAVEGQRVLVGAPGGSPYAICDPTYGYGPQPPMAYVVAKSGETWGVEAVLDPAQGTSFWPGSVGFSGDLLAFAKGAGALLFREQEGSWVEHRVITYSLGTTAVVGLWGEDLLIGQPFHGSFPGGGRAPLHRRDVPAPNEWGVRTTFHAPGRPPGDTFGAAVAVWNGRYVLGAPFDDGRGKDAGAAYVFELHPWAADTSARPR